MRGMADICDIILSACTTRNYCENQTNDAQEEISEISEHLHIAVDDEHENSMEEDSEVDGEPAGEERNVFRSRDDFKSCVIRRVPFEMNTFVYFFEVQQMFDLFERDDNFKLYELLNEPTVNIANNSLDAAAITSPSKARHRIRNQNLHKEG